jgi:aspartate racemase
MKTIGLIGGMSWESSAHYYRIINERARELLGGLHSARSLMLSVDFHEIERMQAESRWDDAAGELAAAAQALQRGGAECVVLCTNTMHKVAAAVEAAVSIPVLHIAEPTAQATRAQGLRHVGLLGTRYTMEEDFYAGSLRRFGELEVSVPDAPARTLVNRVIYEELCLGRVLEASRQAYRRVIADLVARGAQGIVLGCTEIMLLVGPDDAAVPLFDTTTLHAQAAVDFALGRPTRPARARSGPANA